MLRSTWAFTSSCDINICIWSISLIKIYFYSTILLIDKNCSHVLDALVNTLITTRVCDFTRRYIYIYIYINISHFTSVSLTNYAEIIDRAITKNCLDNVLQTCFIQPGNRCYFITGITFWKSRTRSFSYRQWLQKWIMKLCYTNFTFVVLTQYISGLRDVSVISWMHDIAFCCS